MAVADSERGFFAELATPFGPVTVVCGERGLRRIHIGAAGSLASGEMPGLVERPRHSEVSTAVRQLREYLAGHRTTFDLSLDLRGTVFQVAVWRSLARVPFGCTSTYAEQARSVGRPRAVRAVGSANGRNPVPIVLPCHRIIASDGTLGGYSGGLDVKEWLLGHESRVSGGGRSR
ncbi:MAG: hypothetical protein RLZZ305_706 [Actinomycetota bacterium]|jgi:methylated-DNA-[protein]-cysteine S-methyltransferase